MTMNDRPFDRTALQRYLSELYGADVQIEEIQELKSLQEQEELKEFGYGNPLLVVFTEDDRPKQVVISTMQGDRFGHNRRSDRARNLLLDYDNFNVLPQHVQALDIGAFTQEKDLVSLGSTEEFFLITEYVDGEPYAKDLQRIAEEGALRSLDETRVNTLADYLAKIHAEKETDEVRYERRIRNTLGHGEGIMGLLDSYPEEFEIAPPHRLNAIEKRCVDWRWRIKNKHHRLSQVHGDFHPWNVLFREGDDFSVLDRSRGQWGEPADDLSAMTINYILFSLKQRGHLTEVFRKLFERFWSHYLEISGDTHVFEIVQPFFVWRTLVVAHPVWYPSLAEDIRKTLFHFIHTMLELDRFEPYELNDYLS